MRLILVILIYLISTFAIAEQIKDRKDFLVEAITSQRDIALRDAASCYADASDMISKLKAEIAELKAPKKDQ